jgi:hypothetical protein
LFCSVICTLLFVVPGWSTLDVPGFESLIPTVGVAESGYLTGMTALTTDDPRHRTADAMRSMADEISDWSREHGQPRRAQDAADWVRQAAAQVEDDPARRLAYETTRRVRRPTWATALVLVSVAATIGGVVAWSVRRRRRPHDSENELSRES